MDKNSKIYVAGHSGMVGSALVRVLKSSGYNNLVLVGRKDLDLTDQFQVSNFFEKERPEYVFLAAAKVGGIKANNEKKADFIYDNLMIQNNIIKNSFDFKVKKLLFLGSSCIYPKLCSQPIKEEYLLNGYLEETNDSYAIAKIAGIKMCQSFNQQYGTNFISVMPTNLYGPNDNYDLNDSHVLPALIRKFHEAKVNDNEYVEVWGTGKAKREFLYVDDLAEACLFLMEKYDENEIINVGTGEDLSIIELVEIISEVTNFKGQIKYNTNMPDGTPVKLLDISKIKKLGWSSKTDLLDGIKKTYLEYVSNIK